jgi:hypothetical protein
MFKYLATEEESMRELVGAEEAVLFSRRFGRPVWLTIHPKITSCTS